MAKMTKQEKRVIKHKRVRKKISGSPTKPRLSVYRSNSHIQAQIIDDVNGKTLASASTISLKLTGANVDNAKKVGKAVAEAAAKVKITDVVFDRGGYIYTGKIKALAESAREAGLKF